MPDLDLSEEDFKTHWMLNPVEQESTDGNGHTIKHTDKRVCNSFEDYSILRDKGWVSISDIYDSHTKAPSEDPSFTTTPSDLDDLTLVTDDTSDEESDVDTNE